MFLTFLLDKHFRLFFWAGTTLRVCGLWIIHWCNYLLNPCRILVHCICCFPSTLHKRFHSSRSICQTLIFYCLALPRRKNPQLLHSCRHLRFRVWSSRKDGLRWLHLCQRFYLWSCWFLLEDCKLTLFYVPWFHRVAKQES